MFFARGGVILASVIAFATIAEAGEPLPTINACGDLIDPGDGCLILEDDSGTQYALQNSSGFNAGDRVFVSGEVDENATPCPGFAGPAIVNNSIDPCYETYGVLQRSAGGCQVLRSDDMGVIAIENSGGFAEGDYVYAAGIFVEGSTLCADTDDAIEENTIQGAFAGCGMLTPGPQGCPILVVGPEESYFIENIGDFTTDDTVYARGILVQNSEICAPFISVGIERNEVGLCAVGCGQIVISDDGCPLFVTEQQGIYYIENLSGYMPGPRLLLLGGESADPAPCSDPPAPLAIGNTIRNSCPGDLNADGDVSTPDLAILLGSWGPCGDPCPADFSGDGMVGARDLSLLLANWTGTQTVAP